MGKRKNKKDDEHLNKHAMHLVRLCLMALDILEYLFPKDKTIFLMCGGGGYAGFTKNLLVSLGWDENKIYNVGGYWYYEGKNYIEVKTDKYGDISYQFYKIPYHNIDFDTLHEV